MVIHQKFENRKIKLTLRALNSSTKTVLWILTKELFSLFFCLASPLPFSPPPSPHLCHGWLLPCSSPPHRTYPPLIPPTTASPRNHRFASSSSHAPPPLYQCHCIRPPTGNDWRQCGWAAGNTTTGVSPAHQVVEGGGGWWRQECQHYVILLTHRCPRIDIRYMRFSKIDTNCIVAKY